MVEKNFSCKSCLDHQTKNLCIANCIGCKNNFCIDHLIEHRRELGNEIDQLIHRHDEMKKNSFEQMNIQQHFEFIEQWECEMMEYIHKHTFEMKDKLQKIFDAHQSELKQHHAILEEDLQVKRNSNQFFETDINDLSQRIEQLDKEVDDLKKLLHNICIDELNQLVNKYKLTSTIEKSIQWNCVQEIKLDSTYGYMAASNQQIFLGWKNRLVIYNLDGTKYDETRLQSTNIYGELCDLIWSSTLQGFFILCRKSLFVHYSSSQQIEIVPTISLIHHHNRYLSITSCNDHLILLNEKSLDLWKSINQTFSLFYSISISHILKNLTEEHSSCIRANEQNLAILIQNKQSHSWRIDLYNLFPFQRLYIGTSFDHFNQSNLGLIMSFQKNSYLFMNWETKLMRLISQNGSNDIVDYNAYNACLLGTQRKLVVNFMTYLKVYEF